MTLLEELDAEYAKYARERGLEVTLDELDSIFFIRDLVQKEGFVSTNLGRMISHRISESYYGWINFLHRLIMPSGGSLIDIKESKLFENKEHLVLMFNKFVELVSRNTLIGLNKNKEMEAQFIRDAVALWKTSNSDLIMHVTAINAMWKSEKKEAASKMSYSG
jgi:hypothetical protein